MVKRIEALADAIGKLKGIHDPESSCYALRNPLMIKSYARPGKHETDEKGYRIFPSFLNGYRAGLFDLELKLSGRTRAKVKADSALDKLLACYEIWSAAEIDYVVSFLRRALGEATINGATPSAYFLLDASSSLS